MNSDIKIGLARAIEAMSANFDHQDACVVGIDAIVPGGVHYRTKHVIPWLVVQNEPSILKEHLFRMFMECVEAASPKEKI